MPDLKTPEGIASHMASMQTGEASEWDDRYADVLEANGGQCPSNWNQAMSLFRRMPLNLGPDCE